MSTFTRSLYRVIAMLMVSFVLSGLAIAGLTPTSTPTASASTCDSIYGSKNNMPTDSGKKASSCKPKHHTPKPSKPKPPKHTYTPPKHTYTPPKHTYTPAVPRHTVKRAVPHTVKHKARPKKKKQEACPAVPAKTVVKTHTVVTAVPTGNPPNFTSYAAGLCKAFPWPLVIGGLIAAFALGGLVLVRIIMAVGHKLPAGLRRVIVGPNHSQLL